MPSPVIIVLVNSVKYFQDVTLGKVESLSKVKY